MRLISEQFAQELAEQIRALEQQTEGEVVTVLARASDDYLYIPTLWAAFVAMLSPLVLQQFFWLEWQSLVAWQWGIWLLATLLFRWRPLCMRLVPKSVQRLRAGMMARQQFLAQGLHGTRDRLGVLIFVSEAEHHVEILADQGVSAVIDDEAWQGIVDAFVLRVKRGDVQAGFRECVRQVGEVLIQHFPATAPQNELPDRLIILD